MGVAWRGDATYVIIIMKINNVLGDNKWNEGRKQQNGEPFLILELYM